MSGLYAVVSSAMKVHSVNSMLEKRMKIIQKSQKEERPDSVGQTETQEEETETQEPETETQDPETETQELEAGILSFE